MTNLEDQEGNHILKDKALISAFPELEKGFKSLSLEFESKSEALSGDSVNYTIDVSKDKESRAEYTLDSGVKITTSYSQKPQNPKTASLSQSKPVKQLITIDNLTIQDITLTLNISHTINARDESVESIFWDGRKYQVTD